MKALKHKRERRAPVVVLSLWKQAQGTEAAPFPGSWLRRALLAR
jgi:hypothetical protein